MQNELIFEEEWEEIDVTPRGEEYALLAEMIEPKPVTLQWQIDLDGDYFIKLNKRYLGRTDVAKVTISRDAPLGETLQWISDALRKLNKKEL